MYVASIEALASRSERALQSVQKDAEYPTCLSDRYRDGFWCRNLRPGRDYVEREFFYVVLQFTLGEGGEQYEAIVSRTPLELESTTPGNIEKSLIRCGAYQKKMILLAGGGSLNNPHWTAAPAWLAIRRANQDIDRLAGPQYFSPQTRQFRRMGLPWSTDTLSYVLQRRDQSAAEGSQPLIDLRRDILPREHELYGALAGMRIFLDYELERLDLDNLVDVPLQFSDCFFGPLDYSLSTANWAFKRTVGQCADP